MRLKTMLICFLVIILLSSFCAAMGLRGMQLKETLYLVPGYTAKFAYQFSTNSGFTEDYELYVRMFDNSDAANLTEYFTIDKYRVEDVPTGSLVPFTVTVQFPEEIPYYPPGMHEVRVGARETESLGGGIFGVRTAAEARFFIIVLDENPFVAFKFACSDTNVNEKAKMVLIVSNWGKPELTVQGKVDVYDSKDNHLGTVSTETKTIESTKNAELVAYFDTYGLQPATYKAKAELSYNGKTAEKENTFRIGSLNVQILEFTKSFKKDAINKFKLKIRSGWNDEIPGVHGKVTVNKDGAALKSFETLTTNLLPWETKELEGYFDTEGLDYGTYDAVVNVFYENEHTSLTDSIVIEEESPAEMVDEIPGEAGFLPLTTILIIIAVLLVILIVVITIKILKK